MQLERLFKKLILLVIYYLRPLLGSGVCRFPISCSQYAFKQLEQQSLIKALWRITKRLILCTPFIPINRINIDYE